MAPLTSSTLLYIIASPYSTAAASTTTIPTTATTNPTPTTPATASAAAISNLAALNGAVICDTSNTLTAPWSSVLSMVTDSCTRFNSYAVTLDAIIGNLSLFDPSYPATEPPVYLVVSRNDVSGTCVPKVDTMDCENAFQGILWECGIGSEARAGQVVWGGECLPVYTLQIGTTADQTKRGVGGEVKCGGQRVEGSEEELRRVVREFCRVEGGKMLRFKDTRGLSLPLDGGGGDVDVVRAFDCEGESVEVTERECYDGFDRIVTGCRDSDSTTVSGGTHIIDGCLRYDIELASSTPDSTCATDGAAVRKTDLLNAAETFCKHWSGWHANGTATINEVLPLQASHLSVNVSLSTGCAPGWVMYLPQCEAAFVEIVGNCSQGRGMEMATGGSMRAGKGGCVEYGLKIVQ